MATNSLGSVTSSAAVLSVTQTSTDQKIALVRLMTSPIDFYDAINFPLEFTSSADPATFVNPASVCASGSVVGSFNGGALPAVNVVVPMSGTLAATGNACSVDGTAYTGSSSVAFSITSVNPDAGTLVATVGNLRLRETSTVGGAVGVKRDVTVNGNATVVLAESISAPGETTGDLTLTPALGAAVTNALTNRTATFVSGSYAIRTILVAGSTATNGRTKLSRQTYNSLTFQVGGVTYVATGGYEYNVGTNGVIVGSGAAILSSNGVEIGRIRALPSGVTEIVVDGTALPLKAAKNAFLNR